ncbi:hypothetical protein R3P38DRAFT_2762382 [Favolaschia claudopus]|uniref:Uncharacterized protein n=1 Tax=Favolaschia claudopus TaxID=2862362 RepID=A0AAW0DGF7_9AGAR
MWYQTMGRYDYKKTFPQSASHICSYCRTSTTSGPAAAPAPALVTHPRAAPLVRRRAYNRNDILHAYRVNDAHAPPRLRHMRACKPPKAPCQHRTICKAAAGSFKNSAGDAESVGEKTYPEVRVYGGGVGEWHRAAARYAREQNDAHIGQVESSEAGLEESDETGFDVKGTKTVSERSTSNWKGQKTERSRRSTRLGRKRVRCNGHVMEKIGAKDARIWEAEGEGRGGIRGGEGRRSRGGMAVNGKLEVDLVGCLEAGWYSAYTGRMEAMDMVRGAERRRGEYRGQGSEIVMADVVCDAIEQEKDVDRESGEKTSLQTTVRMRVRSERQGERTQVIERNVQRQKGLHKIIKFEESLDERGFKRTWVTATKLLNEGVTAIVCPIPAKWLETRELAQDFSLIGTGVESSGCLASFALGSIRPGAGGNERTTTTTMSKIGDFKTVKGLGIYICQRLGVLTLSRPNLVRSLSTLRSLWEALVFR